MRTPRVLPAASFALLITAAAASVFAADPSPPVMEAKAGQSPPSGYRREHRVREGLVIGGILLVAAGSVCLAVAPSVQSSHDSESLNASVLALAGLMNLLVGIPLLIVGVASSKEVDVKDAPATARLSLWVGGGARAGGVSFAGSF